MSVVHISDVASYRVLVHFFVVVLLVAADIRWRDRVGRCGG